MPAIYSHQTVIDAARGIADTGRSAGTSVVTTGVRTFSRRRHGDEAPATAVLTTGARIALSVPEEITELVRRFRQHYDS
jgi:hypothetical protein